jgi:hypothetical protein
MLVRQGPVLGDIAQKFLEPTDALEHAFGSVGQAPINDGFELGKPMPNPGQVLHGTVGIEEPLLPPEIKNGPIETDVKFAPRFAGTGPVPVRNFGINKNQVARPARDRRQLSRLHASASGKQVNEGVSAKNASIYERYPATVSHVAGKGDAPDAAGNARLQNESRTMSGCGHAKTYMFFAMASIEEKRMPWYFLKYESR